MRPGPLVVALATGLLPVGVLGAAIELDIDIWSVESALEFLTCLKPVPQVCFEDLLEQATSWCGHYLSKEPVTVYRTTTASATTETVTETATATSTSLEVDITTVEVTQTTTVTDVAEATVTETVTVGGQPVVTIKRRTVSPTATTSATTTRAPSCIDLNPKDLLRHPASRLSKACSCLNPQPSTVTLDITAAAPTSTVTATSTVTVVVPETTVSTELATTVATQDVTVTETTTATATVSASPAAPDPCAQRYTTSVNLSQLGGMLQNRDGVATSYECCQLCYRTESCAGAVSPADGQCGLLIMPAYELDFPDESQCRYGEMRLNDVSAAEGGFLFKGPCWYY